MSEDDADTGVSQNTKMELAKALLAVKSVASSEDFRKIREILVPKAVQAAVDEAVHGLTKEDEFAMMCRLMGTATHLVRMDQRPIIDGEFLVPDFLARFQPGCTPHRQKKDSSAGHRCLVEVKSTKKHSFKVGGKKLKLLRAFADQFGLPLLFAVRFLRFEEYALWVIVEDADRTKNHLNITYNHLSEGVRQALWDDYMYMVNPWLCFRAIYDSSSTDESGYRHSQHGLLREFHIVSDAEHPITGTGIEDNTAVFTGIDAATFALFFQCFVLEVRDSGQRDSLTSEILQATRLCSIADMLYRMNRLPRDTEGRAILDPTRLLATDDGGPPITRSFIEGVVKMVGGATLGIMTFGHPDEHLQKWQRLGGSAGQS
ncbi:MAG TPA: hypothetical protein VM597_07210 [Gemmataceae bacterium]|nr:hypothetical protein [Gemmataceae bacterium]